MDVEIFEIMDEIMEINHQITAYLIDFLKADMSGVKIKGKEGISLKDIDDSKILKILFERLQEKYRKIQEIILEENNFKHTELEEQVSSISKIEKTLNNKLTKSMSINDLETYLENSYIELNYIAIRDGEGNEVQPSIYKNQGLEELILSEYNLQVASLEDIDIRTTIREKSSKLSFQEKSYILSDIAMKRFFKQVAGNKIDKLIKELEKNKAEINPKEYAEKRQKLYEQKYINFYAYLNNKYNGVLQENDIGKLSNIKTYVDNDMIPMALNMTEFEVEEILKLYIDDNKSILNEKIEEIYPKKRKNKTSKIVQNEENLAPEI